MGYVPNVLCRLYSIAGLDTGQEHTGDVYHWCQVSMCVSS